MPSGEFAFRRANISLYRTFAARDDFESYPFLCECPEERCTQLILVSLPDYAGVRSHLGRFIVAAGGNLARVRFPPPPFPLHLLQRALVAVCGLVCRLIQDLHMLSPAPQALAGIRSAMGLQSAGLRTTPGRE